jgi:hypothetical protein
MAHALQSAQLQAGRGIGWSEGIARPAFCAGTRIAPVRKTGGSRRFDLITK